MSIIYWSDKQAPLQPEQVDGNFKYLEEKIEALQAILEQRPSLAGIELKDGHLQFKGSDGSELPPIKLPTWTPRGQWKKETAYFIGDVVYTEKCLYLCTGPCTDSPPSTKENWSLLFSLDEL